MDKEHRDVSVHTEENYLRAILESYHEYNHAQRLEVAKVLYERFKELPYDEKHIETKRGLYAEIFVKLMQVLEDQALFMLMFVKSNSTPFKEFVKNDNASFREFFRKARRGLTDKQILHIYGLGNYKKILENRSYPPTLLAEYEKFIEELILSERERLKNLGKIYIDPFTTSSGKRGHKKSNVVQVYQNIKHGYKVINPTETAKLLWPFQEDQFSLDVVEDYIAYKKLKRGRIPKNLIGLADHKFLKLGGFSLSDEAVALIYERIVPQCDIIALLAEIHLGLLDNESFVVEEVMYQLWKESASGSKVGRNDLCPCSSEMKFKYCHGGTRGLKFSEHMERLKEAYD